MSLPLKRFLVLVAHEIHRAKATVLMRGVGQLNQYLVYH
ncbi:MAG: hypothetical protein QOH70_1281 [Blastocatellia bacterium]|nr:hypothetical protein [Blastocatellia bacterium]